MTDEASSNFTFEYDVANRLASRTAPNGVTTDYEYDGMSRLKRLKHYTNGGTLYDDQYTYNTANQISQIAGLSQTRGFTYDNINRLTGVSVSGTPVESYTYDAVGNRTASHLSSSYTTGAFNRLTATDSASYSYNNNGSMTGKTIGSTSWTYGWDRENKMISASDGTNSASYQYDALGRRVKRTQGGTIEKYAHDGLDVVLDDVNSTFTKYQNGSGIDDKLKQVTGSTSKYFLGDHLGSTAILANSSGASTDSSTYHSFGNGTNGGISTRYQFTGREMDGLTSLQYSRARFYDQDLGRFISEDPIGFSGGDVNLYGYVRNQPLWLRDSSGLQPGADVLKDPNVLAEFFRALAAVGSAVVGVGGAITSSPGAVAAGGLAAGAAIGYPIGAYTASHPSNPFVYGPLNPFGTPYPANPPLPPSVVRPKSGPACQPMTRAVPWTRTPSIPWDDDPDEGDRSDCDSQLAADEAVCSQIADRGMKAACYKHAFDRWASCRAGRNIPYNPWPDFPWD